MQGIENSSVDRLLTFVSDSDVCPEWHLHKDTDDQTILLSAEDRSFSHKIFRSCRGAAWELNRRCEERDANKVTDKSTTS